MTRLFRSSLLFVLLLILLLVQDASAAREATVGADGSIDQPSEAAMTIAASLMAKDPTIQEDVAIEMATLIVQVKDDKETKVMLAQMVKDNPEDFASISQLKPQELTQQLSKTYEELKMIEALFKDPHRAVRLMEESGMLPPEALGKYKEDPSLLEQDTRKGMYFMFVAVAEAAGYLEK